MASVRRKPGSRFWYACYTDADGVQQQRSTKLVDRAKAQRVAEAYEVAHRRRQTESQIRRTMADIFEHVHGESLCHYTLNQWFTNWLQRVKPEVDPQTYDSYEDMTVAFKMVDGVLAEEAKQAGQRYQLVTAMLMDRIDAKHVVTLRNKLATMRSSGTTNHKLKILRQCFKAAWIEGIIPDNPVARVQNVKADKKEEGEVRRPFTLDELNQLLKVADDEWRGMIYAGLYSGGQRLADITSLTAGQVNLERRIVKIATDKTGRDIIAPINEPWMRDIRKRVKGKPANHRLFPVAYGRFIAAHERVTTISNSFRRLLARIGLALNPSYARDGAVKGRRKMNPLSYHSLRHTTTSMLSNAGVGKAIVMDIVGHDSEAVSANYTHIDLEAKRAAMEKLPDISA